MHEEQLTCSDWLQNPFLAWQRMLSITYAFHVGLGIGCLHYLRQRPPQQTDPKGFRQVP